MSESNPIVQVMADFFRRADPVRVAKLRLMHADDGSGRCLCCRGGGDLTGRSQWPCTTAHALGLLLK